MRRETFKNPDQLAQVGLLDIFGFEAYQEGSGRNSFEQLCINYANEKLQQQFNVHIFTEAQELYQNELPSHSIETVSYSDNSLCIELLESKLQQSFFKIMEEELVMKGKDNDALLGKFDERLVRFPNYKKSKFGRSRQFTVAHFASDVTYDIDGFLQKNMD